MSRLLFAAAGGHGHLQPLLPIAEQACGRGHDVLVTGAAALGPYVTARGLRYAATGPDLGPVHAPLVVHDLEEERQAIGTWFVARLGRARATDVLGLCRSWRPDVVLHDEVDFGSVVAAEAIGVPHVGVNVIGAGGFITPAVVRGPLDDLARELGLPDQDTVSMLHRHLTLTPFPAAFRDPDDPLPGPVVRYRQPVATTTPHPPTAYVTLGTIFNTESGDLLRTAALGAAACAEVERVVVTTGEHLDPAALPPLPAKVAVERFVDQDQVLAGCDVVVSHAGSGTVLGALRHGLPHVTLPMGADQRLNAARLRELGAGLELRADAVDVDDVRDAVRAACGSPDLRRNAGRLRAELEAMGDLRGALDAVQELVT